MSTDIEIKSVPAITVVSHRTPTTAQRIFTDIPDGLGRAVAFLESAGAAPSGIPFTLYHQVPDGDAPGEISLCLPVDAQLEPADGIEVIEMAACTVAAIVHTGPYEDMGDSYASVGAWIHEHGHRIAGLNREVYLNTLLDVAETGLLTEIQWPIDNDGEESAAD